MRKSDQIIKTGQKTLDIELQTLVDLRNEIGEEFVKCVNAIFQSKGRVVVTGVGKSALIAQKMVATFNSTGTHAVYMHAADAVHGDLGMIEGKDIILCLSKSGETAEIKILLPILKNFGNLLIGMTALNNSYLAKFADYLLHTPVSKEAEPNQLAPTASSIAQMAMGDALASALLKVRGFSHENFARFHPGGSLGKQLYLKVSDIYPQNERPRVALDTTVKEVIIEMTSKRLGLAVVCNEEDIVKGVITDGDLRRMLEKHSNIDELFARNIMSTGPKTMDKNALAVDAFHLMQKNSITQVIITGNKKYLGVVHIHDLIKEGFV